MGIHHSIILVVGLQNTGKTHFLDWMAYGKSRAKWPTMNIYETHVRRIRLIEYGGAVLKNPTWISRAFNTKCKAVCIIVNADADRETLLETRNLFYSIFLSEQFAGKPLYVIHSVNNSQRNMFTFEERKQILQTEIIAPEYIHVEFNPNCQTQNQIIEILR